MNNVVCCFCAKAIIGEAQVEISAVLEEGARQSLWAHQACLASRLHSEVPTLAASDECAPGQTLTEKVVNVHGVSWLRTHGTTHELLALCSSTLHPDADGVSLSHGQITCPDCVEIIRRSKAIAESNLAPEYGNELFLRRVSKDPK
jgi:hypothetical protein